MTKRIFITIILLSAAISASAQKKHAQAYLGAGYGIFSGDMYNAGGADFNIGIKYFATDYVFIDLTAQLGSSKGRKTQTINMNPPSATPMYTSDRFEHTLAEYGIMLGPGYNLYNNGQSRLYVKAQAGYTWGHEYKDVWNADSRTRDRADTPYRPGFAAACSLGYDWQKAGSAMSWGGKMNVYYIRGHAFATLNAQIGVFF